MTMIKHTIQCINFATIMHASSLLNHCMDRKSMNPQSGEKVIFSNQNNALSYHILFYKKTVEEELKDKVCFCVQ